MMENITFTSSSTDMVDTISCKLGSINIQNLPLTLNRGLVALKSRVPNTSRTLD